jgi:hypothetical protein
MVDWLQKAGPTLPDDPVPQAELLHCRTELIRLLRSAGRDDRAKSLELERSSESTPPKTTNTKRPRN